MTPLDRLLIGRPATLSVTVAPGKRFRVPVLVMAARIIFGRRELLVAPADGAGDAAWVSRERVQPA